MDGSNAAVVLSVKIAVQDLLARCHTTGRVSIGLGAVLLLDVNHEYYCTY